MIVRETSCTGNNRRVRARSCPGNVLSGKRPLPVLTYRKKREYYCHSMSVYGVCFIIRYLQCRQSYMYIRFGRPYCYIPVVSRCHNHSGPLSVNSWQSRILLFAVVNDHIICFSTQNMWGLFDPSATRVRKNRSAIQGL